MGIIKGFADSLFSPRELRTYSSKGVFKSLIYVLFLALLFSLPTIIGSFNAGKLSYETKVALKEYFENDADEFPCVIQNGKLISENGFIYSKQITETLFVYVGETYDHSKVPNAFIPSNAVIAFLEDGVYLESQVFSKKLFEYVEYIDFEGLDFNGAFENDNAFWDSIFRVYNNYYKNFRTSLIIFNIIFAVLQSIFTIVIFGLLVTLFNRFGGHNAFRFKTHYKITLHGLTAYVLGNVFSIAFSFGLLYYVGIIWSLAVCIKSTSRYERGDNNEL